MTPITVSCWPDETTRTPNSACAWVAEATVDGRTYTARSRHGSPNELARQLVDAELPDRPMLIHYGGCTGAMTYRSFHAAATWTFREGDQPLHRVQYREQPEGLFLVCGTGQKCVSSPRDDEVDLPAADTHETHSRTTRCCEGCESDFLPARPWSRFCSPACRLRSYRRLARQNEHPELVVEYSSRGFG